MDTIVATMVRSWHATAQDETADTSQGIATQLAKEEVMRCETGSLKSSQEAEPEPSPVLKPTPPPITDIPDVPEKKNSKWEAFPVEQWRDAVYVNEKYFRDLCEATTEFITDVAEDLKLCGHSVSLIEVGCGTGEFVRGVARACPALRTAIGVDFNENFIKFCDAEMQKCAEPEARIQRYIHGDACKLNELLEDAYPRDVQNSFWGDARIVACVGNTIGIIPEHLKSQIYQEMAELAGQAGVVLMVYWNARCFGDAAQNFYHANPQLCGEFTGDCIDFVNTTLTTPSGYRTKWTSLEDARKVIEEQHGLEIISIKEKGKGVLVAARKPAQQTKVQHSSLAGCQSSDTSSSFTRTLCTRFPPKSKTMLAKQHNLGISSGSQSEAEAEPSPIGAGHHAFRPADRNGESEAEPSPHGKGSDAPEKKNSKWEAFPVEQWRDAVYVNEKYFRSLCEATTEFITGYAEKLKLVNGRQVSLVEVGCGTGEFVRAATSACPALRTAIGVDFNENFIKFCEEEKEKCPTAEANAQHYLHGDACELNELLKRNCEQALWEDIRIVACVGNTIGIIPEELKGKIYKEMAELAGPNGVVIMVYWNARCFGDAAQNFYHANPQLCGAFTGESIDLDNTTLTTPSGYRTKWTSVEDARKILEVHGLEIISLKEKGKGVLVAARQKKRAA